jgi:tRNA 2-thiouridine synthesizing protein E
MAFTVDGKDIDVTATGFLVNIEDWNENIAIAIAKQESIELTDKHWDVINYLRDEYINHNGNNPNTRTMIKALGDLWGQKIGSKDLFELFPGNPSKQAGRIAGLPESKRKGGY